MFKRFYRLPGSAGDGSGLGLAIVQEIAQAHRACIKMDTPQGGGTRIQMSFASVQSIAAVRPALRDRAHTA